MHTDRRTRCSILLLRIDRVTSPFLRVLRFSATVHVLYWESPVSESPSTQIGNLLWIGTSMSQDEADLSNRLFSELLSKTIKDTPPWGEGLVTFIPYCFQHAPCNMSYSACIRLVRLPYTRVGVRTVSTYRSPFGKPTLCPVTWTQTKCHSHQSFVSRVMQFCVTDRVVVLVSRFQKTLIG